MNNCPHCGKPLNIDKELYKKIYGTWTTKEIIEATNRILNEIENKNLKLNLKDSTSPVLIEDPSDKNSFYVIMPMKI